MTNLLARLRIYLHRVPVPGWLACTMGDHKEHAWLDEYQVWWQVCGRCGVMREDNRLWHGIERNRR